MGGVTFEPGDLVRLKSGGRTMVVEKVTDAWDVPEERRRWWSVFSSWRYEVMQRNRLYAGVYCVWQNERGEHCDARYQPEVLEVDV